MDSFNLFLQFLANGVVNGSGYVLVAVGLTLIFGILGVVNFAHGEFYMLGGYAAVTAAYFLGWGLLPTFLIVAVALGLFGILSERIVFRPLAGKDATNAIIASFGLSVLLQNGALLVFGAQPQTLRLDGMAQTAFQIGPVFLTGQRVLIVLATLVLVSILMLVLRYTWTGRALRAMAQHPMVAQISGVHVRRVSVVTFAVGAALAGIAGGLMSAVFMVQPTSGSMLVLKAFTVVILGGMGSVGGAVTAGLLLGIIEAMVSGYLGNELRDMIGFFLVIVMLLVRPQGLFGRITERS
ncbi:branched-chain amino acid ABC transporter permease [Castellaniella sp.]|uniref:branched-chain amino acid ABC transporter permease n=1 Tax=Castellaniella sp. TaxID=1955812 RepID=UPI00355EFF31